ncbi:MAG TPA: D-xylose ABC transporter ATP-binding protein [Spirochaetaceae bacterium]|nr:D-xylose ABC transporter ATP-binding protein [Spirochaetaceae bacterium]
MKASAALVSLRNVTKTYPGVTALRDLSLDFYPGEVHALLGENGAGKSTLIKIIAGAVEPDSGSIQFGDKVYERLSPHEARMNGVEVIYQEFNLIGSLSAAENIALGERAGMFVDFKLMETRARELFDQFGIELDPASLVRDLTSSQQQIVEIAKAVSKKARILIMDEPTAPLSVSEVDSLFRIIRMFRDRGVSIIYISHRIDELFEIADRISVLRDGAFVADKAVADTDRRELISLMVGRELKESYPARARPPAEALLELQNLCGNGDEDISFSIRKGEIFGLAGLVGAGRTELAKLVYGAAKLDSGSLLMDGKALHIRSPRDAIKNGIGLIPENRKEEGCFLDMPIDWNISFPSIRSISRHAIVDLKQERKMAEHFSALLRIRTPSLAQKVKNLSGGNQQKVVLAKTLATDSKLLIFDEPTRGIDVGARQEIYKLMTDLANKGHAIMMISSDMEELLGMSDRIAVLAEGRLMGILERPQFSQKLILELASGIIDMEVTA